MAVSQQRLHHGLVVGEISEMMRVMRQNRRWRSSPSGPYTQEPWLIQEFQSLRWSLDEVDGVGPAYDRTQLIRPFVAAIRSEEASGPITGAALTCLHRLISAQLFAANCAHSAAAIVDIADAGTHCRFEATDAGNDELVLMKILQVHLACFSVENGIFLTDTTVWEMVQTCFRIFRQMRPPEYSQLLSDRAKHSLFEMIRLIFGSSHLLKAPVSGAAIEAGDRKEEVHLTNVASMSQHFGIACMVKVLGSLVSMGRSSLAKVHAYGQKQQILLVLQLILDALEFGGGVFERDKSLFGLIQDDVCSFLLQNGRSKRTSVICLVMRIFHCIVVNFRHLLKVQFEAILNTVFLGSRDAPYEIREIILESLLDLAQFPWFSRELYANYDCSPRSTNAFQNLLFFLCDFSSSSGNINSNNALAIRCLNAILRSFLNHTSDSYPAFDVEGLLSSKRQKTVIFACISSFNEKPMLGFKALVSAGVMDSLEDFESAAQVLFHTPTVDKATLGEFLGSPLSFASDVRDKFIGYFDFRGKDVVEALRVCLEGFRLPAEAQQIDRVVQTFSEQYYAQNKRDFANADVIHILTFALIMLNTDAHNDGIKHKMTLEQFMKNVRGINNGESFPEEFLENLYKSIVSEELKLSKVGPGGEFSRSLWTELLTKSESPWGQQYLEVNGAVLDSNMFALIWHPISNSISLLFEIVQDDQMLDMCMSTFEMIGMASCQYRIPDAVDSIVSFCCQASGLLEIQEPEETALAVGRSNSKTQASIRLIFHKSFGGTMQASWGLWVTVLYQLLRLGFLPDSFSLLDDFLYDVTDQSCRRLHFPDYVQKPVSLQSIFSSVQSFLMASSDQNSSDIKSMDQVVSARDFARVFVQELDLEELLINTVNLPTESFLHLIGALTFATKEPVSPSSSLVIDEQTQYYRSFPRLEDDEGSMAKQLLFFLQLLTNILIRNRKRAHLCWDAVSSHFYRIFCSQFNVLDPTLLEPFTSVIPSTQQLSASDDMAEAVSIAALQLFLKLGSFDSPTFPISFLFRLFVGFDIFGHPCEGIGRQVVSGILRLSHSGIDVIRAPEGWQYMFSLLQSSAASANTFQNGFEGLALILSNQDCSAISAQTVPLVVRTALKFAQSKAGSIRDRLLAIDHFLLIHGRLSSLSSDPQLDPETVIDTKSDLIGDKDVSLSCRLEIYEGLRIILCTSEKFSLREHALATLQTVLLSPEAKQLSAVAWKQIFENVIIRIMAALGSARSASPYLSKCRCAATAFVCRLFLIYLSYLLTLEPSQFEALWVTLLTELVSFVDLESDLPSQSLLAETVTESLKNTLRVMRASEIEDAFGDNLWALTWQIVDPFIPQLREEVFPKDEQDGVLGMTEPVSELAAAAVSDQTPLDAE